MVALKLPADAGSAHQQTAVDVGGQRHQKIRVVMRHVFRVKTLAVIFSNKAGVEVARDELRVGQQSRLKRNIAADAANHKAVQRLAHFANRLVSVFAVHDELGNHRVVMHRYLAAVLHTGVYTHAVKVLSVGREHGFWRRLKAHQPAG